MPCCTDAAPNPIRVSTYVLPHDIQCQCMATKCVVAELSLHESRMKLPEGQDRANLPYDVIVIGSGMGGLSCAAALTRAGRRVLVLEQHFAPGGLTQTFARERFHWDVGVHYLGEMGENGQARRVIDWLSGNTLDFAPLGP